jgi:hypothetical protein
MGISESQRREAYFTKVIHTWNRNLDMLHAPPKKNNTPGKYNAKYDNLEEEGNTMQSAIIYKSVTINKKEEGLTLLGIRTK